MNEQPALEVLIEQLQRGMAGNPDAEWQAAITLGDVQSPANKARAVPALLAVLANGHAHALTRTHAVEALGKLGERQAVPVLLAALHDPYRLVRAYAATALGAVGDERAIEPLLSVLEHDEFFGARAEAVCAVAAVSGMLPNEQREAVRAALIRQREVEAARAEPGTDRVVAEIDRVVARLGGDNE